MSVLAFFSLALRLLSTRSVGFVDEIDSSLHPNYVQELVALFKDPLTNPHQSQLIFTTHDVSLITRTGADKRVLDQDQIWFAEKGRDGSSALYPVTSVASAWRLWGFAQAGIPRSLCPGGAGYRKRAAVCRMNGRSIRG